MYDPPVFREDRIEVMRDLMRAHPLATVVSLQAGRLSADHLPLGFVETADGGLGSLRGHVAKANPIWRNGATASEVLAVFQGPQTYVTPSWYQSKKEHGKVVPTWNYAIVQARGTLKFSTDAEWLQQHVAELTTRHEAAREAPWQVSDAPAEFIDRQIKGIVGIEIEIAELKGKWKVSQNREAADRLGVAEGLRQEAGADAHAMADLVSRAG